MSAGALDPTFGTAGVLPATVLAIDAQGRYLVGGTASGKAYSLATVTRLNPDGSTDSTFGVNGTTALTAINGLIPAPTQIFVEPSGKLLINYGGIPERYGTLTQLTAAGQIDPTFGTNGTDSTDGVIALDPDGTIISANGDTRTLERLTANGQVDESFGTNGQVSLDAAVAPRAGFFTSFAGGVGLTVDATGRPIIAVEIYQPSTGEEQMGLIRYTTAGTLDATFGTGGVAVAPATFGELRGTIAPAVAPDGTVYAADSASAVNGTVVQPELYAFAPDGRSASGGTFTVPTGGAVLTNLAVDAVGRPIVTLFNGSANTSTLDRLKPIAPGGAPTYDPTFAASGSVVLPTASVMDGSMFLDASGNAVVPGSRSTARVLTAGPSAVQAVAAQGTVIGSTGSWSGQGNTVVNAFDGNLNTFYDAYDWSGDWAGLDLGASPRPVVQFAFAPRAGYESRMVGGQFQVSSTADFSADVQTIYTITSVPTAGVLTTVAVGDVGTYEYIRYLGPDQADCNVAEVQFRVAGYAQLAGTAIGSAGSWSGQGNTFAKAFDGNVNTFYDAYAYTGDWVGEDLGLAQSVLQVKVAARAGYEGRMVGGMIQASTTADFSNPVTIYTFTQAPASGVLTTVSLSPETGAYRYWRYTGPTGGECNIAEVEFDGLAG